MAVGTAAELRSIERDLHDVTQAQMVAIAMKLSDAKDRHASNSSDPEVGHLLDQAHAMSKVALTDLRALVQGIHPAALNSGLATALATLTSSAPIPTALETNLTAPISPSIEAVAYYCTAELLNNVAKHAQSPTALVRAHTADKRLVLQVSDQGVGGAIMGASAASTGLVGLQQRISGVQGTLRIDSPAGGPTLVIVELPTTLDLS